MRDFFYVKNGSDYLQILFSTLLYAEAVSRYVRIVTIDTPYLIESSLAEFEHSLPEDQFCRIHKSYIISLRHTKRFNNKIVLIGEIQLPIGRQYRESLLAKALLVAGTIIPAKKQSVDF